MPLALTELHVFWLEQIKRNGDLMTVTQPPGDSSDTWRALDDLRMHGLIRPDSVTPDRYQTTADGEYALYAHQLRRAE